MAELDYVAQLVAAGATPIPDSEIVDRGNYYEWTAYNPDLLLWLREPAACYFAYEHTMSIYGAAYIRDSLRLFFYPKATDDKPVRVVGWFKAPNVLMHYRISGPRQKCTVYRTDYRVRPDVFHNWDTAKRISGSFTRVDGLSSLLPEERVNVIYNRAFLLPSQSRWEHQGRIFVLLGAPARHMTWWRGRWVDAATWAHLRTLRRQLGALIADPDSDSDELIDMLDVMNNYTDVSRPIEAWNAQHPFQEVGQCTCGHFELQNETVSLIEGRTACRTCYDEGLVVDLEDRSGQDLEAYAYQHDDGLWYTYAEDEEPPEPNGLRGYYSNVLDYQLADRTIKSSPYGDFLMGIELEVVPRELRSAQSCVDDTQENLCDGYAILKHDGSLDEGGFEIVTAPRGLAEHVRRFKEWTPHRQLRAWDAGCCGLHVHLSSQAFTQATLGKFIEFINSEANDEFIRSIAGRHPRWDSQAADYAQREGDVVNGNPKKTCQYKSCDRYHMVNTTNLPASEAQRLGVTYVDGEKHIPTVELRIFRASLKKERLLAQIEFAHAAVMFCRWSSMRELTADHFLKWLQPMAGIYPNLAKWFGVKANKAEIETTPKAQTATADV